MIILTYFGAQNSPKNWAFEAYITYITDSSPKSISKIDAETL